MKRLAAKSRLTVIRSEMEGIFKLFPELRPRPASASRAHFYSRQRDALRRPSVGQLARTSRMRVLS